MPRYRLPRGLRFSASSGKTTDTVASASNVVVVVVVVTGTVATTAVLGTGRTAGIGLRSRCCGMTTAVLGVGKRATARRSTASLTGLQGRNCTGRCTALRR